MLIYKGEDIRTKWSGLISVKDVKRPLLPSRSVQLITAAGMVGAYQGRVKRGIRVVEATIRLLGALQQRRQTAREIAAWLDDDVVQPLSFTDEPDKTYYAIADGNFDFDESSKVMGEFALTFLCPDPYAVGVYHDLALVSGTAYAIAGTVGVLPKFIMTIPSAQSEVSITAGGKTVRIIRGLVAGDVVEIDNKLHSVKLNGVDTMTALTIDSRFITLPSGEDTTITWSGNATVRMQYSERWK
jgi:predicted phage tail component-like protein